MLEEKLARLDQILLKYEQVPIECDGHTLIVSNLLRQLQITHERAYGEVVLSTGQIISPHLWITCHSYTIDYRLRMWGRFSVSDLDSLPHGLFFTETIPSSVEYVEMGNSPAPMLSDDIFDLLTDGYWTRMKADLGI